MDEYSSSDNYQQKILNKTIKIEDKKEELPLSNGIVTRTKENEIRILPPPIGPKEIKADKIKVLPPKKEDIPTNASINGMEAAAEFQRTGNCFCCAGANMLNQFLRVKKGEEKPKLYYNQHLVREYEPLVKKYQPGFAEFADEKQYEKKIQELGAFAGEGKQEVGNLFEIGDYFLESLEGEGYQVQLNKVFFLMPGKDKTDEESEKKVQNIKNTFLKKVTEAIRSKNVVAFCIGGAKGVGHYYTITGIKGEQIEFLDSASQEKYNQVQTEPASYFLRREDSGTLSLEMEYLSDLQSTEELTKEYSNLSYNEETGYIVKELQTQNVELTGQTKGICVTKQINDTGYLEGVEESVYIPNPKAKVETESLRLHVKRHVPVKEKYIRPERYDENGNLFSGQMSEEERKDREIERYLEVKKQYAKDRREETQKESQKVREEVGSDFIVKDKKRLKKTKEDRKEDRKKIKQYEKKAFDNKGDYETFGVGFNLQSVDINAADSSFMQNVKTALASYLKLRETIFNKFGLRELTANQLLKLSDPYQKVGGKKRLRTVSEENAFMGGLDFKSRNELSEAYGNLIHAIKRYKGKRNTLFQSKRRKERLKQIEKLQKELEKDDYRFKLNSTYTEGMQGLDMKYHIKTTTRKNLTPNLMMARELANIMALRVQAKQERLDAQNYEETKGTMMPKSVFRTRFKDFIANAAFSYHSLGAMADRALGFATMVAANGLELAGKAIKLPFKILSSVFNFGSKHVFHSKKRWRMTYSLKKGWKNLDDGRRIFRRYLKLAFLPLTATVETVGKGIPYLFGKKSDKKVYGTTVRWMKDVGNDIQNVFKSLSDNGKYHTTMRSYEDMEQTSGFYFNENHELVEGSAKELDTMSGESEQIEETAGQNKTVQQEKKPAQTKEREASPEVKEIYRKVDSTYKNTGIPKDEKKELKEMILDAAEYKKEIHNALPPEEVTMNQGEPLVLGLKDVDERGFLYHLKPVRLNKEGDFLTEEDRKNREYNLKVKQDFATGETKDRAPHLDTFARDLMLEDYTLNSLKNKNVVENDPKGAMQYLSRLFNMNNMYTRNRKYYLTQAPKDVRIFCYLMFEVTSLQKYLTLIISNRLNRHGFQYPLPGYSGTKDTYPRIVPGMDYKRFRKETKKLDDTDLGTHSMFSSTFNEITLYGDNPFDENGQEKLSEAFEDNGLLRKGVFTNSELYDLKKRGVKTDKKGKYALADVTKLQNDLLLEFYAGMQDEAYQTKMCAEIDDFLKNSGLEL